MRRAKSDGGGSFTYKRGGAYQTAPVLHDGTANYLPGISEKRSGTTTFLHSGIKNGLLQTNTSQTNTATNRYDAFGNVLAITGTWKGPFAYGGKFGYQTDEADMQLLGDRYYDPTIGRFLSRDVARQGRNWYSYCESNPIVNADINGQRLIQIIWAVVWELPQAAAGAIGSIGGKLNTAQSQPGSFVIENSWFSKLIENTITLGPFILTNEHGISDDTLAHERIHIMQSRRFGWVYIPAHALAYGWGLGESLSKGRGWNGMHDASILEQEADLRSARYGNVRRNPFLWERYR